MPFRYGTCICIRAFLRRRAHCAPGTHRGAALKIAGFSRCVSKKEALCEKAGKSKARQRYSKSMEGKTAPLSTHISFFVPSPMARPCCLLPLWTCTPRDSVKKQKERLKADFQTEFRAALDLKSSAGRWGTLETAIDFGAFGFILYDTRAGRKRPRIKTSKAHCGRQRGGWA